MKRSIRPQRRLAAGVAMAATASLLLAGCVGGATTPDEGTSDPDEGTSDSEPITDPSLIEGEITLTTFFAYIDDELLAGFNEQYPNVDVTLEFVAPAGYSEHILALSSTGDLPDLFTAQGAYLTALAEEGQLWDVSEALTTQNYEGDRVWEETFLPGVVAGVNSNTDAFTGGVPVVFPFSTITVAGLYNTEIFEEVGVQAPETFDELLENCRALDAAGYIPMSLTGQTWISWFPRMAWDQTMRGSDPADFSVEDPNYIRAFELVSQMAEANCWDESQISTDIAGETSLFLQRETAQFVSVPENFLATVLDGADFEVASYALPALDGQEPSRNLGGNTGFVIPETGENKPAAVALMKYLTSVEVQSSLAGNVFVPPAVDVDFSSSEPIMAAYSEAAAAGFILQTEYMPSLTPDGTTIFDSEVIPRLILGEITPEEAAAATADLFT